MISTVCTLFEGDHHLGVGALFNSLYAAGFRGTLWAGYRGTIPPWALPTKEAVGYSIFHATPDCCICFVPVVTDRHLTNYKACFIRHVLEGLSREVSSIFYFDPDVIVRFPWKFFENWVSLSVALSEDVNSPMPDVHPKRNGWRRFFAGEDIKFRNPSHYYVNGGFVGLPRANARFLSLWESILDTMDRKGVDLSGITRPDDYLFWNVDQDALNIAAMATDQPMSIAGKDGMGFIPTNGPMLHAIGARKPWRCGALKHSLAGYRPTQVEREYWDNVEAPIRLFPPAKVRNARLALGMAGLVGRFYHR